MFVSLRMYNNHHLNSLTIFQKIMEMKAVIQRVIKSGSGNVEIHPVDDYALKIVKTEKRKNTRDIRKWQPKRELKSETKGIDNETMEADVHVSNRKLETFSDIAHRRCSC